MPTPENPTANLGRLHLRRVRPAAVHNLREVNQHLEDARRDQEVDEGDEALRPMSDQVAPPKGVPRAAASGIFAVSTEPEPDPPTIPPYVGDMGREFVFETDNAPSSQRDTIEIETRDDVDLEAIRAEEEAHPAELESGDDVKVGAPAEESGRWDEADDAIPIARPRGPSVLPRPQPAPPYGLVASIILVAAAGGFLYGMLQPPPAPSVGPPPTIQTVQANTGPTEPAVPDAVVDPQNPESVNAALGRARAHHADGETAEAHRLVAEVLDAQPNSVEALVLQSSIFIDEHRMDDALAAAQASVRADANFADGHLALGAIRQERKEYGDAIEAYQRYLELAPKGLYSRRVERQLARLQKQVDENKAG